MRRPDREMSGEAAWEFLSEQQVGRLGMSLEDIPYVIPVHFVVWKESIVLHMASHGRKSEILRNNDRVCFEVDEFLGLRESEQPCGWGTYFRSVVVEGRLREIDDSELKHRAMTAFMDRLAPSWQMHNVPPFIWDNLTVAILEIQSICGKQNLPS